MEQTFLGLIKHAWGLIRNASFSEGRVSRGEYWISILLLSTTMALVSLVLWLLSLGVFYLGESAFTNIIFTILTLIASLVVPIIVTVFQIKLIIKRSHDVGKNGRYTYIPMFIVLGCLLLIFGILRMKGFFTVSETEDVMSLLSELQSSVVLWIIGCIAAIALIRSIARGIVIGFYRGNVGDNNYGSDPLLQQASSNGIYRGVGIALVVVNIIVGMANTSIQSIMFEDETNFDTGVAADMQGIENDIMNGELVDTILTGEENQGY